MGCSLIRVGTLSALLLGVAGLARAQHIASSFDQLQVLVGTGDVITVTGSSGGVMTGRILDLSPSTLRLQVDGQPRDFAADDVRTITQNRHSNLATGAEWGFPVGFVFGMWLNRSLGGDWSASNFIGMSMFGAMGSGVGVALAAATITPHVIFAGPANPPKITLVPLVDRDRKGLQVRWRF